MPSLPSASSFPSPVALYSTAEIRHLEEQASNLPLMQRAGKVAAVLAAKLCTNPAKPILILAGPGNNGGDAFEAARLLREAFFNVVLVFTGSEDKLPKDAKAAYSRFLLAGGTWQTEIPATTHCSLIIDGLFGIGLTRKIEEPYITLIRQANLLSKRDQCPLLALDSPSGLNAQTGRAPGITIKATHTVTFIGMKPGLLTADGPDCCGEISVASLDLDVTAMQTPSGWTITPQLFTAHLEPRVRNSHKGSFGNAGLLGGSESMTGALLLAARAALYLGGGRIYAALLDERAAHTDPLHPEIMFRAPKKLLESSLTALACGPGLESTPENKQLLSQAFLLDLPLVVDAGALNLLATEDELILKLLDRTSPTLMTPHPTEAARLLGIDTQAVQADRVGAALRLAKDYKAYVALKGCGTVIATPEQKWFINTSGNPGLATAGTGDVLTGILCALLAQGWTPCTALLAGVHLHGLAADKLVAGKIGPIGMTAGELLPVARHALNEWINLNSRA